jgi:hypothetical protein
MPNSVEQPWYTVAFSQGLVAGSCGNAPAQCGAPNGVRVTLDSPEDRMELSFPMNVVIPRPGRRVDSIPGVVDRICDPFTFTYKAGATSMTLSFVALNDGMNGPIYLGFDNVSMVAQSAQVVPASALGGWMLLSGFGLTALLRRRRAS